MTRKITRRNGIGSTWLLCCVISGLLWVDSLPAAAAEAEPLKVIFDTDIDGDNDDVAAAAILHSFADAGRVEILAMGVVSLHSYSPACLDAINTYYEHSELPGRELVRRRVGELFVMAPYFNERNEYQRAYNFTT